MPKRTSKSGSELFIVDNSDHWTAKCYLHDCTLINNTDVAARCFAEEE